MYSSSNYLSWDYTVLNSLIRKSTSCQQGATGPELELARVTKLHSDQIIKMILTEFLLLSCNMVHCLSWTIYSASIFVLSVFLTLFTISLYGCTLKANLNEAFQQHPALSQKLVQCFDSQNKQFSVLGKNIAFEAKVGFYFYFIFSLIKKQFFQCGLIHFTLNESISNITCTTRTMIRLLL